MKLPMQSLTIRAASTVVFGAALAACGGGGSSEQQSTTLSSGGESARTLASSAYIPQSRGTSTPSPSNNTGAPSSITDVRFESTSSATQTNVPVTFGQVFAPGDLAANASVTGRLDSGVTVPLQLDVKAKHADGSIRHAVISAVIPSLGANEVRTMTLTRTASTASTPADISTLLNAGFTSSFSATVNGVRYTASADELMKKGKVTSWLSGQTANEWHVSAPLTNSAGAEHPHLSARFAVRWYGALKQARVDVAIENNWTYEPAPQNFTYNAELLVGGKAVYSKPGMVHYHHARWRKTAWFGAGAPEVNVKLNTGYLIASRALPNYDQSLSVPESYLASLKTKWTGQITEPMNVGVANPYMPNTGGREDIGLQPGWNVTYLLSMDQRARNVALGTADLSGSWSAHYRDKQTGYPVSVIDYPYMTVLGRAGDAYNRPMKRNEAFPPCASADLCATPFTKDTAHQPNFAYLPYLVTGDYYYLEELQFWTMWSVFSSNPYYREFEKGLVHPDQVRGQAWSLRTLAESAYITPDTHPLKDHFLRVLDSNLTWFNSTYINNNVTGNALGIITNGYSIVYDDGKGIGPWQDDFFTSAVGHAAELGFTKAEDLLRWKAQFPIQRMVGQGVCWIGGAIYSMRVRESKTSPLFTTIAQAYKASSPDYTTLACGSKEMATSLKLAVGEMAGYSTSPIGYPSNMQPALAYAANVGGTDGKKAWAVFMARTNKPDYSKSAQFAIVPR